MQWFEDSIADAVNVCKQRNSVFVVYIEGTDDLSRTMSDVLNKTEISNSLTSDKFVSIKVTKGSDSHQQFNEIYKLVPVPSVFFIGENGVPLEIVAGDSSEHELVVKLRAAIKKTSGLCTQETTSTLTVSSPSSSSISQSPPSAPSTSVGTNIRTTAQPSPIAPIATENGNANEQNSPLNEQQLREIMAKKREEAKQLEEQKEKDREIARRKMGRELSLAKKTQQEREAEEARRERERDKREEALARERVLRQIEEDKAMRAAKLANATPAPAPRPQPPQPANPSIRSDNARLQFKLPDGQARTNTFAASATIRDLRNFIDSEMKLPFTEYSLCTAFPRREFTSRDLDKDLTSLELTPSAVILIMPLVGAVASQGPGWAAAISALLWTLVQPLTSLGQYIRSLVWGSPPPPPTQRPVTPQPPQHQRHDDPQPSLGPSRNVRKRGNVHSLHDADDSNDENNTWNGNSTQLM